MNLPTDFEKYTRHLMGEELFNRFLASFDAGPSVSIRVNPTKCSVPPIESKRVDWCEQGYYLSTRPQFTFDPLLHAGCYYVQEASSMFLYHILKRVVGENAVRMLDMCAAPGGKSTTALSALPCGSILVSNEVVRQRANVLAENIQKWGNPNVIVTNNTPETYAHSGLTFDVVLCDVPCSGEGMFRKDEGAIKEWSRQNVEKCHSLQRSIVNDAWQCLADGGLFIYSTCTFNALEDEDNVEWICSQFDAELLTIDIDEAWGITGALAGSYPMPVYRFIPGVSRGEGLFLAVFRKRGGGNPFKKECRKNSGAPKGRAVSEGCKEMSWLASPTAFQTYYAEEAVTAIPQAMVSLYNYCRSRLKVLHAGVLLGKRKGKDIIPDQSLALSICLNTDVFPKVDLCYDDAISYLRKELITLSEAIPRGFVLATYQRVPLGFLKNIGNRANNLYPQEWKIKSSHIPAKDNKPIIFKQ